MCAHVCVCAHVSACVHVCVHTLVLQVSDVNGELGACTGPFGQCPPLPDAEGPVSGRYDRLPTEKLRGHNLSGAPQLTEQGGPARARRRSGSSQAWSPRSHTAQVLLAPPRTLTRRQSLTPRLACEFSAGYSGHVVDQTTPSPPCWSLGEAQWIPVPSS